MGLMGRWGQPFTYDFSECEAFGGVSTAVEPRALYV